MNPPEVAISLQPRLSRQLDPISLDGMWGTPRRRGQLNTIEWACVLRWNRRWSAESLDSCHINSNHGSRRIDRVAFLPVNLVYPSSPISCGKMICTAVNISNRKFPRSQSDFTPKTRGYCSKDTTMHHRLECKQLLEGQDGSST